MSNVSERFKKLAAPFPENSLEWRIGNSGSGSRGPWAMVLAYISARSAYDRFDDVFGPENWKAEYVFMDKGVVCKLSICIDGVWISKEDGSDYTDIESFKGGISGAFKRAASVWGCGRYLYDLTENFARVVEKGTEGAKFAKTKDGTFYWVPPSLPDWALPESERSKAPVKAAKVQENAPRTVTLTDNKPTTVTFPVIQETPQISKPEEFLTPPVTVKPSGFKKVVKSEPVGGSQW